MYATIVKTTDGLFIVANSDGSVQGSESEAELVRSWERMYKDAHTRGYERSMSACVHMLFFQPSIIQFEDVEDLLTFLEHEDGKVAPFSLSSVAGSMTGLRCTDAGQARWDAGIKPDLV